MIKTQTHQKPYFQSQSKFSLLCGLHAVNNLLGQKSYTQKQFNQICDHLKKQSNQNFKHRLFGGDYDVSVLISALHQRQFDIQWHDARIQFNKNAQKQIPNKKLQGYLVNVKMPQRFYHKILGVSGRHWVSIKLIKNSKGENIYLLDSKDQQAKQMDQHRLLTYLDNQRKNGAQILKVYSSTIIKQQN